MVMRANQASIKKTVAADQGLETVLRHRATTSKTRASATVIFRQIALAAILASSTGDSVQRRWAMPRLSPAARSLGAVHTSQRMSCATS